MTSQEKIIEIMNNLKPYERVEIVADKQGKVDTFLVIQSSKFILTNGIIVFVK